MEEPRDIGIAPDGTVLRAIPGDDPAMRQVAELCYETLHRPFGVSRNDAWDEGDPASTHIAAMRGDRVVGYARVIVEGRWAHVRQVLVVPDRRGAGIATALVEAAIAEARRLVPDGVYLHARRRAVRMYQRLGFRVTSEAFRMPRTWLPHVRMELPFR